MKFKVDDSEVDLEFVRYLDEAILVADMPTGELGLFFRTENKSVPDRILRGLRLKLRSLVPHTFMGVDYLPLGGFNE